jgi:hypothetical protein
MSKIRLVVIFIFFTTILPCQNFHKTSITVLGEYGNSFDKQQFSGGFQLEVCVSENPIITLNYKYLFGGSNKSEFYMHTPAGAAIGGWLLANLGGADIDLINGLGILLLMVPEGITLYPLTNEKRAFGIFASPLCVDYWNKSGDYDKFILSGEGGGKLTVNLTNKCYLSTHIGVKQMYHDKKPKTNTTFLIAGAGLTFYF